MKVKALRIIDLVVSILILATEIACCFIFHLGWKNILFFIPSVAYEIVCVLVYHFYCKKVYSNKKW